MGEFMKVVPIVGLPNVGKSTLINQLFGRKISVVTNKPHTTRTLLSYSSAADAYLIDTPGIEKFGDKLGVLIYESMQKLVKEYEKLILVLNAFEPEIEKFEHIIHKSIVVINKIDYVRKPKLLLILQQLQKFNPINVFMICAKTGDGVEELQKYLIDEQLLTINYDFEENLVQFACECVREKILTSINKEIPYKVLVVPKKVIMPSNSAWELNLDIIVPKKNYKMIILGKNGSKIKEIGIAARLELVSKFAQNGSLYLNIVVDENLWKKKESYEYLGWS